jgi:nicotinamidase-related amidase
MAEENKGFGVAAVLLLVDVQGNMLLPPEPVPDAEAVSAAIEDVLGRARSAGAMVVHVRNNGPDGYPDAPGTPGWELVHEVRDGEHVVDKDESDAFDGTPLAELVPPAATVVVTGMQSEYCVRETSLAALRRGHRVLLVRGAHATYDDELPAQTISGRIEQELSAAGVSVVDREDLSFS